MSVAEAQTRQRWNLDPKLSETEKRKARRLLRAQLAKAKQTGEYPDSLKAAMATPGTAAPVSPNGSEDEAEEAEAEESDSEAELPRRGRRGMSRAAVAAVSVAPANVEAITAELRERLEENPELQGGYMFSFKRTTVDQMVEKFTKRMGYPPTEFRLDREHTVLMGPSNLSLK